MPSPTTTQPHTSQRPPSQPDCPPTPDAVPRPPDRATLASSLRLACMRISRRVRLESPSDVAPHQFSVLCRLSDGPRTPRELADIEKVSPPSMTRTVAGLVDAGWVRRADDPSDGRQIILTLSPEGEGVVRETRRAREGWMAQRLDRLTPQEIGILEQAVTLLERVANE